MALISCKECLEEISDTATVCPHCGARKRRKVQRTVVRKLGGGYWTIVVLVVATMLLGISLLYFKDRKPFPIILKQSVSHARSSALLFRTDAIALISNNGGKGKIRITFTLRQGDKEVSKDTTLDFLDMEQKAVSVPFDEIKLLDGEITEEAEVTAL